MREVSIKFLIYFKSKYFPQIWMEANNLVHAFIAFLLMYETELLNTGGFLQKDQQKPHYIQQNNRPFCHLSH